MCRSYLCHIVLFCPPLHVYVIVTVKVNQKITVFGDTLNAGIKAAIDGFQVQQCYIATT